MTHPSAIRSILTSLIGAAITYGLINGALWIMDSPWRFGWYR